MCASVKFYIDQRGPANRSARQLYAQVVTDHGRFRFRPGVEVEPDYWNTKQQKLVLPHGGAKESKDFNDQLEIFRTRVMTHWLDSGRNPERFKQLVKLGENAPPPPKPLSLQDAIALRLADKRSTDSASTRAGYEQLLGAVQELAADKPLPLADLTYSFYVQLRDYFLDLGQINSSVNLFMGKFRTVLSHVAERHPERVGDELAGRLAALVLRSKFDRLPDEEPDIILPTYQDVLHLAGLDLSDEPELALTRDRYVFACFTGPRHSDLNQLDREFNLSLEESQGAQHFVLRYMPVKTKRRQPVEVPLNHFAYDLLSRNLIPASPLLLQRVDNRRDNERLHRILREFGGGRFDNRVLRVAYQGGGRIDRYLPRHEAITFHSSRHFFAVILINNGVALEHVKELLGQKNLTSTLRYAKAQAADVRRSAVAVLDGLGSPSSSPLTQLLP